MGVEFKTFPKKRSKIKSGFPTGTTLFTGSQGMGKTLSATHYIERLKRKYPNVLIFSNITLTCANKVITVDELEKLILMKTKNRRPIIFFLDEIQTVLFNNKSNMSFEVFRAICQQRKANKTIIGTLQNFLDLDMTYRRQINFYVEVGHIGPIQWELWRDGQSLHLNREKTEYIGNFIRYNIWKRHDDAYNVYDTFEIVNASLNVDINKAKAYNKTQVTNVTLNTKVK